VAIIIDGLSRNVNAVAEIYAGLILLGIVPAEDILRGKRDRIG
jgi:hypothetical protein